MNLLFKKLGSAILLMISMCLHAASEDITIKGMSLGASIKEFSEKFPEHDCSSQGFCSYQDEQSCINFKYGEKYSSSKVFDCFNRNSFGGSPLKEAKAYFKLGKLTSYQLIIRPIYFEDLIDSLSTKYGKTESIINYEIKNNAGASFINKYATWTVGDTTLTAMKYCGTLVKSCIDVSTVEEKQRVREEFEESKKRRANDF